MTRRKSELPRAVLLCVGLLLGAALRTPLCKISSTGEIEQRFRLN